MKILGFNSACIDRSACHPSVGHVLEQNYSDSYISLVVIKLY